MRVVNVVWADHLCRQLFPKLAVLSKLLCSLSELFFLSWHFFMQAHFLIRWKYKWKHSFWSSTLSITLLALISLRICLLSASLSVFQWPFPYHSLSFSLLSFFLRQPLCLQHTPKRAAVHFSCLASFLTFPLFFSVHLLPVHHKGLLKKRLQGRRWPVLMVNCAGNVKSLKAAWALEVRCWGLEKNVWEDSTDDEHFTVPFISTVWACVSACLSV